MLRIAAILTLLAGTATATATSLSECGNESIRQTDYRGDVAKTVSGRDCQKWDDQSPHKHTRTHEIFPGYGLDENYCRNPDGEPQAWCYTTDTNKRWEFCAIPNCYAPTNCANPDGDQADYRGTVAVTKLGRDCQRWDSQSPHSHTRTTERYPNSGLEENYCRNPDGEPGAWCYTTEQGKRWELCDVAGCKPPTICYDYTDGFNIGPKDCTPKRVLKHFQEALMEKEKEDNSDEGCEGGLDREIFALTRTTSVGAAFAVIQEMCDEAFLNKRDYANSNGWESLEDYSEGSIDLDEFFQGSGFLNKETGNFQQEESSFIKHGGDDRFFYIGDDPRKNDYLPTTNASYFGGQAISKFYMNEASGSFLTSPTSDFQDESFQDESKEKSCSTSNAAVCCWSRDRQYFDNNGNCNFASCKNKNPGDNTDLCWTVDKDEDDQDQVFPYPGGETENDLHCHGFAWAQDDLAPDDINVKAKWNNLFFISMYDHLYQRGYVESITDDPHIAGQQAMCGCVEDMNPVARADCTEIIERTNYTAFQENVGGALQIHPAPGTFHLEFKACEGYNYDGDVTPEDYAKNPNAADLDLENSNNDLAAFVFRQYLEGKIDEAHVSVIEKNIIGYRNPSVNKGDVEREEACKAAFKVAFDDNKLYPGLEWVEREIPAATPVAIVEDSGDIEL